MGQKATLGYSDDRTRRAARVALLVTSFSGGRKAYRELGQTRTRNIVGGSPTLWKSNSVGGLVQPRSPGYAL